VRSRSVLTSLKNPKVAAAVRLHKRSYREQDRAFLVEGAQGVAVALEDPGRVVGLFVTDGSDPLAVRARQAGTEVLVVSDDVVRRLTSTVTPQGAVAVAPFVDVAMEALPDDGCLAVLHEVRDPGNAGTVLRSADAAGAAGVVFTEGSVDVYNPKTVRASAGSVFHVPVVREVPALETIATLRGRGFRVLAMDAQGARDLYTSDLSGPIAYVFGNEAHGLPAEVRSAADATVRVPLAGRAESLNLAAAASVCLFEWARRRARSSETLETIIAAAAHDIRSPLTAMKGFGYTLERRWNQMTDDQRGLMLQGIVYDADRMDQILRLLVDAARVVAGSLEIYPEQTDLSDLVASIAEGQRRDPEHPSIEWSGDAGPFMVDAARIRSALLAFCESLVWWGERGPIRVVSDRADGGLHLQASRASQELSQEAADDLFVARRPGTGSGSKIGLWVTQRVAESRGGRSWATVDGGELSFHLWWPLPS
jgi:RNA methyltransferase, TrmH family